MDTLTLVLSTGIILLLIANWFVSRMPKKGAIRVAFIPPSTMAYPNAPPSAMDFTSISPSEGKAANMKIVQLHARMQALEDVLYSRITQEGEQTQIIPHDNHRY